MKIRWGKTEEINSKSFICGFCGTHVSSNNGYQGRTTKTIGMRPTDIELNIHVCPGCNQPNYFDDMGIQFPSAIYGKNVENLPNREIECLYEEARKCVACGANSAAIMCCRILLMHIAVNQGAGEKWNFVQYVNFLVENHFIPPKAKSWVDHIRDKGNKANHEIILGTHDDASELLDFIEMLLRVIYEFPALAESKMKK